ncbi:aminoacyl-tRNA hydrolase [Candidatus Parcubacteria bacterium]|nr:aminoacyl-tRNA hydrolase [Candidatus Parcubacteria bacterium]
MTRANMKIIVGLGNPGEKYNNTRHNAGFMAIDKIVKDKNLEWKENKKFNAILIKDGNTLYIKPQTFMNNSGTAVRAVLDYYKTLPKKLGLITAKNADLSGVLTVIHDDIDIEFGKIKESTCSRSAGHKGVESIINHLKTKNFKRIRIGVKGNKPEQMATTDYVLARFSKEELTQINKLITELTL